MAELDRQLQGLQMQRDTAVKQAEEAAANRKKLEDTNLQLMLQKNQAAIAEIDCAMADRMREGKRVQQESKQTDKKKHSFRETMRVSMAKNLIHNVLRVARHVIAAACVLM
jgi:hypothetical protein